MDSSCDTTITPATSSAELRNETYALVALSNVDILREIFGHLEETSEPHMTLVKSARSNLIAVALTCKDFLNPALDLLWHTLHSFLPLLMLLPSVHVLNKATYVITSHISESEWASFDACSRRVRRFIHTPSSSDESVTPDIFLRLHQIRKIPIFPALRYLYCSCISPNCLIAVSCLSPTIDHIKLVDIATENAGVASLLTVVPLELPRLKHLSLIGNPVPISLDYIRQLKDLRSLELSRMGHLVDLRMINWLNELEQLEELTLDLKGSFIQNFNPRFGHLRILSITTHSPFLASWLQNIPSPLLNTLSLSLLSSPDEAFQPTATYLEEIIHIFVGKWRGSLQNIHLSGTLLFIYSGPIFAPLLEISDLVSFGWEMSPSVHFSDQHIQKMALAWPNLRSLDIRTTDGDRPSFNALIFLAEHCPKLLTLALSVDVHKHLPCDIRYSNKVSRHKLSKLSIDDVVVQNQWQWSAASNLDQLFPHLQSFSCIKDPISNNCKVVECYIKSFQRARTIERRRYGLK